MANWKSKLANVRLAKLENIKLEQEPPNRPSFLLVVLLSGAAIIVIFLIAYFVLDLGNSGLVPKHHYKDPTSLLVMPAPAGALGQGTVGG